MKPKSIISLLVASAVFSGWSLAQAADSTPAPRIVKIRAGVENAMKFDVTSIPATPGETLKVVLTNVSVLPKEVMGHNWILLTAGSDSAAFAAAAAPEAASGYIPAKLKEKIIAYISLLGPNETGEVTFKVPTEAGEYPFLCSFPAHCIVGMKGVVVVKK
jgi:azurin